jgi:hypothetical protein
MDQCVASDQKAFVTIRCDEKVRVNSVTLYYRLVSAKEEIESSWQSVTLSEAPRQGLVTTILTDLEANSVYKLYAVASNSHGESPKSEKVWLDTTIAHAPKEVEVM